MPSIKPISDLRSYSSILDEVSQGAPVLLTRNGRGRHAILDRADFERCEVEQALLAKLEHGKRAAEEHGVLTTEQVRSPFADRFGREGE